MMTERLPPLTPDDDDANGSANGADPLAFVDDLRQLVDDARTLAQAEIAYQSARARLAGSSIGKIAGLGALALALVFFALMALVIGLVLALSPLLGAWGAMAAVMAGLLVLAALAAVSALARLKRLSALLSGKDDPA